MTESAAGRRAGQPAPPPLLRRFPRLEEHTPWLPLGALPTPIEPLRLERFGERHWVKRDDLSGGLYGGNKVRKLEWILAEARRQGAERLITAGAAGSHHALATAVYGRELGFRVTLVLFPQPLTPHVRQVLALDHALGAELRLTRRMETVPFALQAARFAHRREACIMVAPGGSSPLGTLGYVNAALELAEQIEAGLAPRPAVVHVAAGTMGTSVGLAIGFALAGLPIRVAAVRITSPIVCNRLALRRLTGGTLRLLDGAGVPVPPATAVLRTIELRHRCIGPGYGRETFDSRRAAEVVGAAGLTLDATYTAKAAVDFLDALEREPAEPHLFWHTLSAVDPGAPAAGPAPGYLPGPVRKYLGETG